MSEQGDVVPEPQPEPKAITQADIDAAITARLGREQAKHQAELEALKAEKSELEQKFQADQAKKMSVSERVEAQDRRIDQLLADIAERDKREAEAREQALVTSLDSADEKALIEAGFNPKYSSIVLDELKKNRAVEAGAAFYKDSEGAAIDKGTIIDSLKTQYPELVVMNRAAGNDVPTGQPRPSVDTSKETTEQYIERKNRERAEAGIK
jgi:hypothetical protein